MKDEFIKELEELLRKYGATIEADYHWDGYTDNIQHIFINVSFKNSDEFLELGRRISGKH